MFVNNNEALNLYSLEERKKRNKIVLKVKDIMSRKLITLYDLNNLLQLKNIIELDNINHFPVVNKNRELVGLITKNDYLNISISRLTELEKGTIDDMYKHILIKNVMKTKIITTSPETLLEKAALSMAQYRIGCLPVIDGKFLVGIITRNDFLKVLFEKNVNILPF